MLVGPVRLSLHNEGSNRHRIMRITTAGGQNRLVEDKLIMDMGKIHSVFV